MASRAVRFNLAPPSADFVSDEEMDVLDDGAGLGDDDNDEDQPDTTSVTRSDTSSTYPDATTSSDAPRVLSVQIHGGKIGCAFFDITSGKLSLLEDTPQDGTQVFVHAPPRDDDDGDGGQGEGEDGDEGVVETAKETLLTLLEQYAPINLVLTSSDTSARFHTSIRKELIYQDAVLSIRPSVEFSTSGGLQRIASLDIQGADTEGGAAEGGGSAPIVGSFRSRPSSGLASKLSAACAVDLHAMPLSAGAAGALFNHLTRLRAATEDDRDAGMVEGDGSTTTQPLRITSIEGIVLRDCLSLSAETRVALDVFGEEDHAALHSSKRQQEGLSLFSLLDTTRTPLSHSLLRRWLLLPSTRLDVIRARQAAIATFTRQSNVPIARVIERELKGVKNVPAIMSKLYNGTAKLPEWKAILKFCYHALVIRESMYDLSLSGAVEAVNQVKRVCDKKVLNLCTEFITDMIDMNESTVQGNICIKAGYDDELDQWKQLYAGMTDLLDKIAEDVRPDVDPQFKEISICYFPQLGYLLAIPTSEDSQGEVPELDGWDYQFSSPNMLYFKGPKTRDLDTHLGDVHSFICAREIEHLHALQVAICQHGATLLRIADLFAELDCLLALADCALRYDWVQPELTEDNVVEIYQGRHPLQELTVANFVPNDVSLRGGTEENDMDASMRARNDATHAKSLLVVTGANGSGKSVYLKQVGLIVLLAHIGSFVPAQGARVGLCDQILTSIQARHSVSRLQSSYLLDVSQVAYALRQSTRRSLVLFDEIGKGTESIDGAALFAATIRGMLNHPRGCPKTIVATHFHEAFHPDVLPESLPFERAHMEVMIDDASNSTSRSMNGDDLVFLFRLAPGLALTSNAAHLARHFLVPERIVQRAEFVARLAREHSLATLLEDEAGTSRERGGGLERSSTQNVPELADGVGGDTDEDAARRAEEREREAAAEERVRLFLEWDLDEEEDVLGAETATTAPGEDAVRRRLRAIVEAVGAA